jgi:hypothetical protein
MLNLSQRMGVGQAAEHSVNKVGKVTKAESGNRATSQPPKAGTLSWSCVTGGSTQN